MDSLRIDNGIKKIEVNDAGECIEFSINDDKVLTSFWAFGEWLEEQEKAVKELQNKNKESDANNEEEDRKATGEVIALRSKINNESCERIDSIFGTGASRKLFGSVIPDLYMVVDFLDKVTPFIEKYAKEHKKAIDSRYNKNRRGAKS